MRDVSRGEGGGMEGSLEERPYDVSRGQNRYVTLPLIATLFLSIPIDLQMTMNEKTMHEIFEKKTREGQRNILITGSRVDDIKKQ